MHEGRHVARAILADVRGRQLRTPFRYTDKGTMAVIGRNAAVGSIGRAQLTGRLGWLVWLGVHIYYLIGFRNRAVAGVWLFGRSPPRVRDDARPRGRRHRGWTSVRESALSPRATACCSRA